MRTLAWLGTRVDIVYTLDGSVARSLDRNRRDPCIEHGLRSHATHWDLGSGTSPVGLDYSESQSETAAFFVRPAA